MKIIGELFDFMMALLLSPIFIAAFFLVFCAGTIVYFISPIKFWLMYPEVSAEVAGICNDWLKALRLR